MVDIKSKGGGCWHYDTSIVLDGNSTGQLNFDKRLTGILRGNRAVVQRIRKMELRSINQNKEVVGRR